MQSATKTVNSALPYSIRKDFKDYSADFILYIDVYLVCGLDGLRIDMAGEDEILHEEQLPHLVGTTDAVEPPAHQPEGCIVLDAVDGVSDLGQQIIVQGNQQRRWLGLRSTDRDVEIILMRWIRWKSDLVGWTF